MIYVNEPLLAGSELKYVTDCIKTGWVSSEGQYVKRFENDWAAYCGMPHGVAVSSGTAALYAAVQCLDLSPGSEIIVPSFTIISCVQAVLAAGCVPVLVDCDHDTWCMSMDDVLQKITPKTRAIMPVHIYGHPADMRRLMEIAAIHDLVVIEDAAEAHGARCNKQVVGGIGHLSCFSFYANKILTTGEGGMILAKDDKHAERLRSIRNLGFRTDRRFYHTELGNNYRLTNLQAAVGVAQVETIGQHVSIKRNIGNRYTEQLQDIPELRLPTQKDWASNVYWMYGVVLEDNVLFDATEFAEKLRDLGVDTRPFFLGMHEQPALLTRGLFHGESHPVTERISRRGLYLPTGLTLTQSQIDTVTAAVRSIFQ